MKIAVALRDLHAAERALARDLRVLAERHPGEPDVVALSRDLAGWSDRHVEQIVEQGPRYGLQVDRATENAEPDEASEPSDEQQDPGLQLLADLRAVYTRAAGVSIDWELIAQAAQGARDEELIALAQRSHPENLRQMRWADARLKAAATQILLS